MASKLIGFPSNVEAIRGTDALLSVFDGTDAPLDPRSGSYWMTDWTAEPSLALMFSDSELISRFL